MSYDILDQIENQLVPKQVGIEEFAESSDYCNKRLYPRQVVILKTFFLEELTGEEEDVLNHWIAGGRNGTEIVISPSIRERVEWLRANSYKHFREVILPGGRRSSKGFITGIAMAKVMWDCLQLQDPGAHYGIDPEKEIFFSCVAGSEQQAKDFQYGDMASTIENCKSFEPYLVKSLETEIRIATNADLRKINQARAGGNKIQKDIARLRGKALAANAGTLRGSATMCMTIDEMAHMIPGESKAAADKVYEAADPSLDQFGLDGLMFLNSSPYTKVGMFYERFIAAQVPFDPTRPMDEMVLGGEDVDINELNGNPRIMTFKYPSWALYEGYQKSSKRLQLKHVLQASPDWNEDEVDESGEPLWNEKDKLFMKQARGKEAENPEAYKVERRGKFAEVTDAYLNPSRVDEMYAGLPIEWEYEANNPVPKCILSPFAVNNGQGARNIYRYKFHLDPSSTTAGFGFAIAHAEIIKDYRGVEEEHVVFDLIKRWIPKNFPGGVIRWAPILDELMLFADIFRPFEITFDQHQSAEPIQDLQEKCTDAGINTRVYEVTATAELNWKRWEVTKSAIYGNLVHAPIYGTPREVEDLVHSSQELKFLQQSGGTGKYPRIDRQEIGPIQTKDMADCIAECTNTLIGNRIANRTRDRLSVSSLYGGAPGGFGIGLGSNPPQSGLGPVGISDYYSKREERVAREYDNPSRGALGRGRGRTNRNRARW